MGAVGEGTWPSGLGGVSDETVVCGYGSCATLTSECLHCKLLTCSLVREGALHEEVRK
jgi:hypothetical protein